MAIVQTNLVVFNGTDGATPRGSLIADANGDLFGTTQLGGTNNFGTVFEIVKTGTTSYASTPITLFNFDGTNGSHPLGDLIADANGDLFGTTSDGTGGTNNSDGTVFELSPSPPGLSVAATASYARLGPATMLSPNVTVVDAGSPTLASATVTITGGLNNGDSLSAITAGTSITASYNAGTGVLTLTGTDTLAHYASVLRSVSFSSSNQNPTNSGSDINRTVTWVLDDGSGYANLSASVTTVLNIISSNPPPPAGTTALMIMTNPSNGNYEIYDVGGNGIQAAYALGQVGSPWTFAGLGTFQAGDTSDMLLRNTSTGEHSRLTTSAATTSPMQRWPAR